MKVTFTCEKCGHRWDMMLKDGISLGKVECVNCARKLTYGPLTEEMVARALRESYLPGLDWDKQASSGDHDRYYRQARFVLRLLIAARDENLHDGGSATPWNEPGTWRDWLLDLARQK